MIDHMIRKQDQVKQVLVCLTPRLLKRIDAQTKKEKRNRSQFIRKVVEDYLLEQDSAEYFAQKGRRG